MKISVARRKTLRAGLALGVLVALVAALPLALGAVSFGEGRLYDLLLKFQARPPSPSVFLVCIDEPTFRALGNQIPSRSEIARAILNLWEKRPSLIALDLILTGTRQGQEAED